MFDIPEVVATYDIQLNLIQSIMSLEPLVLFFKEPLSFMVVFLNCVRDYSVNPPSHSLTSTPGKKSSGIATSWKFSLVLNSKISGITVLIYWFPVRFCSTDENFLSV